MEKRKWKREDITPDVLRQLLRLDEDTGKLYWRERGPEWFSSVGAMNSWNTRYSGCEAISYLGPNKRYTGKVLNIVMAKPVVVWAIHHRGMPSNIISYGDGDMHNMRPANLILSTKQEVAHRFSSLSKCGKYIGVYFSVIPNIPRSYTARMGKVNIGYFETPIEAARAYDKVAYDKYGEHARLNFPEDYGLSRPEVEMPENYYDDELK